MNSLQTYGCLVVLALSSTASAEDWTMWRGNASRGGIVDNQAPNSFQLQWTREFPAPRPAWPASQAKLQFDASIKPIVIGEKVVVGSTVNDSVAAFDASSGKEVWRFFAEGPIRFAPAASGDNVCFGSDDGWLYCLSAKTGELNWRFNGGPATRRIIGNDRLISSWPVRGGPVIADGTVYFAAGVWPFMGVFIHAVDLETGERQWTNSETGSQWVTHPHGAPSFGSIVPQGYLAVSGDRLIVPGGRSLPAVFDRKTGKLLHFDFGGKSSGGWQVACNDRLFCVGNESFAVEDRTPLAKTYIDLISNRLLVSGTSVFGLTEDSISKRPVTDRRGETEVQWKFTPAATLSLTGETRKPLSVAGNALIAARNKTIHLLNIDPEAGEFGKQIATCEVESDVVDAFIANRQLFVVDASSRLYCFGEAKPDSVVRHTLPKQRPLTDVAGEYAGFDDGSLESHASQPGYAVLLGADLQPHLQRLLLKTHYQVIVVESDTIRVDRLRTALNDDRLYGTRVTVVSGDVSRGALPPYFARFIAGEDAVDALTITSALRPYGGEAWLKLPESITEAAKKQVEAIGARFETTASGVHIERAGALPESGSWTHQYGDAGNSVVSQDRLVKAPLGVLWFGGPPNDEVLPRHGHGPSPQVAGGRLVIEGADMLRCVDVYTGQLLWQRSLPGLGAYYDVTRHFAGAGEIGSNYVTLPDAVYVAYGRKLLELDPNSGNTRRSFDLASPGDAWGFLAAAGDTLVATATPVSANTNAKESAKSSLATVINSDSSWEYLAGSDPPANWAAIDFTPGEAWKVAPGGFGYGDGDDKTVLGDMQGNYQRAYIRAAFPSDAFSGAAKMVLDINFDDAFIAYLNGKEIARVGVKSGAAAAAEGITGHEAGTRQQVQIENFQKLLVEGKNILAIEGHNVSKTSSDFTLDARLLAGSRSASPSRVSIDDLLSPTKHSSASKRLIVRSRNSGEVLWERTAEMNFRHNSIVVADGMVFCIDAMTETKLNALKRRGLEPTTKPKLLALNAKSGTVVWSTEENVFGTFLSYSREHGVLLQAGSAYRDRASDESGKGMIAYRAADGEVLWQDLSRSHGGPCLLWKDRIITNGGGGSMYELLTGKPVDWKYTRMYGCNTAVGSQNLLTFRSGAAGFCDLAGDSGTGNIGGFRSSCTSNLIVADGVLNAPDYTRTCVCAYQNQCSLALVHMPEAESWTFSSLDAPPASFGVNFGAPGDRSDADAVLWYEFPTVGGKSPALPMKLIGSGHRTVRLHSSELAIPAASSHAWVASSAVVAAEAFEQATPGASDASPQSVTVRLHFAELENKKAGERVFDVAINGEVVLKNFDIAREAGARKPLVKEFSAIQSTGAVRVEFKPIHGEPCISGFQILRVR